MKSYKTIVQCIGLVAVCILASCTQVTETIFVPVSSEAEVRAPSITSISEDVSTVINVRKTISVGASPYFQDDELAYQWYAAESKLAEGTAIEGAECPSYSPATAETGTFYYYCTVTGRNGDSVTSPRITYTVGDSVNASKPVIARQPENVTSDFSEDFLLSVNAYSPDGGTLSYQWYFSSSADGKATALEGASESSYKGTVSADTIGFYYCAVTNTIEDNGDGGVKSAIVQSNIVIVSNDMVNANTPTILSQSEDATVLVPAIKVLSVTAYAGDDGELGYQWYSVQDGESEGSAIENETSTTLKIRTEHLGKTGYYCVVTNTIADNGDGGKKVAEAKSATIWIDAVYLKDIVSAPEFTVQPPAMNIAPFNQSIKISCEAESTNGSVSYRWYESTDGTAATGIAVIGETSATLTTPTFTERGIRYFYCVATNVLSADDGEDIKSAAAVSDVVSVACTGRPVVYFDLNEPLSSVTKTAYVQGKMSIISADYDDFSYEFTVEKEGIKGRGNTSWSQPKKGYNIKFDKKQTLFGLPKAKKWCIIANYSDKTLLRNKFASVLGTEIVNTVWNPSFISVDVVVNGEYQGNYIFCEKITLTDGRIEAQDITDVEDYLASGKENKVSDANGDGVKDLYDGGFILEVDARKDADFYFSTTYGGQPFTLKDPDEVSAEIHSHVQTLVQHAEDVLYGENFTDSESGWRKYIDEDAAIDWFIANEFAKNNDAQFFTSVYIYYDPSDGKLHLGPNWDFDIGFGNVNYNNCDNPTGWWIKSAKWIARLVNDPEFVAKLKSRGNEKKSDIYVAVNSQLPALADTISISAEYNFIKWNILGAYVWPNPAGYAERTTYQSEVDYMLDWCNKRYDWLDTAIKGL